MSIQMNAQVVALLLVLFTSPDHFQAGALPVLPGRNGEQILNFARANISVGTLHAT